MLAWAMAIESAAVMLTLRRLRIAEVASLRAGCEKSRI